MAESRLAVLMMVHKDPEMVNRFLSRLACPGVDLFVHVDKKSPISPLISEAGGLMFVADDEREEVRWGGNGMSRAVVKLLRLARAHAMACGHEYHHYLLVSGSDYPIRPVAELAGMLDGDPEANYIDVIGPDRDVYGSFLSRVELYWPCPLVGRSFAQRAVASLYRRAYRFGLCRKRPCGVPVERFYFGSLWWALSGHSVDWMLDELGREPGWLQFFDHSLNPDECLFQTLFMASPYAGSQRPNFTYIDWSEGGSSPKTLRMEDLDSIRGSGCYLARKFDPAVDAGVLDAIDAELLAS